MFFTASVTIHAELKGVEGKSMVYAGRKAISGHSCIKFHLKGSSKEGCLVCENKEYSFQFENNWQRDRVAISCFCSC